MINQKLEQIRAGKEYVSIIENIKLEYIFRILIDDIITIEEARNIQIRITDRNDTVILDYNFGDYLENVQMPNKSKFPLPINNTFVLPFKVDVSIIDENLSGSREYSINVEIT